MKKPSLNPQREFKFTAKDFATIQTLIYDYAGIALNENKQDMVYSRLVKRLREHGLNSFDDYLKLLTDKNQREWEAFTNALTTNLTSFFREEHHFSILSKHLLGKKNSKKIEIWCAAASTGEEAYSIAITAIETFHNSNPPVRILATDLDTHVLKIAQQGEYEADKIEKLPEAYRKYFLRKPGNKYYQVNNELRQMIIFRQLNLVDPNWPMRGPFEAIFCRNVMIYFDRATQLKILSRFAPMLDENGLLFVGHSENLYHASHLFRLLGKTVYGLEKRHLPPPLNASKEAPSKPK